MVLCGHRDRDKKLSRGRVKKKNIRLTEFSASTRVKQQAREQTGHPRELRLYDRHYLVITVAPGTASLCPGLC